MTYVDTSVLLAQVLAEDVQPPAELWTEELVSSRLAEYELWVRLHAYGKAASHAVAATEALARLDLVELHPAACARCLAPFPSSVRTLDALHLATADYLRSRGATTLRVATYDAQMRRAATAMGLGLRF